MNLNRAKDAAVAAAGRLIDRIKADANAARILTEWIGSGGDPVPKDVAYARAETCIACPHNQPGAVLESSVAEAIREQDALRRGHRLTLSNEGHLKSCNRCGCYLKLKVWIPMQQLAPRTKMSEFPPNCWLPKEAAERRRLLVEEARKAMPVTPAAPKPTTASEPTQRITITVDRQNAMGDAILASAVCSLLHSRGHKVGLWTARGLREVFNHHPHLTAVDGCYGKHVSLNGAFEKLEERTGVNRRHEYLTRALRELERNGIAIKADELPPAVLTVTDEERSDALIELLTLPRPLVAICPGSESWDNRKIPNEIWSKVRAGIEGTAVWVGKWDAPEGVFDAKARTLRRLMAMISACDYMISADTGPAHMALALGVPTTIVEGPFLAETMLHPDDPWTSCHADIGCLGCADFKCGLTNGKDACAMPNPKAIIEAHERNKQSHAPKVA